MQPPDENGNEWVDDPTPSGLEIAHVMLERIAEVGWDVAWRSCDGMDICRRTTASGHAAPGTYVFLAGYQDLDYERAFLLTVCTQTDKETWVDYLAVYQAHAGTKNLDVEWAQRCHRFFDVGSNPRTDVLHWWVDKAEEQGRRMDERRRQRLM